MEQNDRPKTTKMDTGKGNALKRLKNITCPYTGIRMISGSEMGVIEERLKGCRNAKEKIYLFSK